MCYYIGKIINGRGKEHEKMLENLKSELVGYKMSMIELDNIMMRFGFESIYDEGTEENIIEDGNGVWTSENEDIQIYLEGNLDNLVVTKIEDFR